jgi:hypothetical protein
VWHRKQSLLDAEIENSTLQKTLEALASATGWIIYVEPDTEFTVSSKFKNRSVADALARLFGSLNCAILPQKNGSSKLFVFRSSLSEATVEIKSSNAASKGANNEDRILNEWVVVMKKGSKTSIDDLAKKYGAKVVGRAPGLNAYRLQWDDAEAASAARAGLESESDVDMIDANQRVSPPTRTDPLSVSSNLPLSIRANPNPDPNRLVIGLIDTAIQPQTAALKDFLLPSISVVEQSASPTDGPTHATSMAETILRGMSLASPTTDATTTRILPVNVYSSGESTTTFDVANGINAAIQNNATLINLSLGGDGDSTLLHQVIQQAHDQGIVFVAAAGNTPTTSATYPAAYPEVMAATSGDKKGNIASYANRGSFIDVVAPGSSIVVFDNQSYLVSGTSASTAYITGATASAASGAGKPVSQIEAQVRKSYALKP